MPVCQAERGGPALTPSPGAVLCQEHCRVQTNLASPGPGLNPTLKDMTGRLLSSGFWQQSNLKTPAKRPREKAQEVAAQQSNLNIRETSLARDGSHTSPSLCSELQESLWPHPMHQGSPLPQGPLAYTSSRLRQSWLLVTDTLCPDFKPSACFAPLDRHTQPGPRSWCGLESGASRLVGEPLTLEDLAGPAQSQAWAPSQAAIHWLLASVWHLEHQVVYLGCQASWEPPGPVQQDP